MDDIVSRLPFLDENAYIAGGAIADVIRGQKPKDIDIFFSNELTQEEFAKQLIDAKWGTMTKAGKMIAGKHHVLFQDKGIVLDVVTSMKIQLVGQQGSKRLGFQTIEQKVFNADFTVAQFVYDGTNLYCGSTSIRDLNNLMLVLSNFKLLDFQKRVDRYINKGYIKTPEIALIEHGIAVTNASQEYKERIAILESYHGSNNKQL
ncbi:hypothetical protein [Planomicrobium sp. Y74]|uniref:hypothetical protein n=1 Tax=Planomicrobium sp. Y74 TaxID=2478977 RepID=UPI00131498E5|nr:hypothetical protein [Planomicrobium sp. Y74]